MSYRIEPYEWRYSSTTVDSNAVEIEEPDCNIPVIPEELIDWEMPKFISDAYKDAIMKETGVKRYLT